MTPDIAAIVERVNAELGDLLEALERDGGTYAAQYAEHVLTHPTGRNRPAPPKGMPPIAATVVREFVLDEVTYLPRRRQGGAYGALA